MEVGQATPRALAGPRREELVVDVLGLDGGEADPLDRRLGEDPPDQPRQRERRARVGAAEAAHRGAAVVRPDVDSRQDDLAVPGGKRPAHVGQHDLGGQRALGAAGPRDDAEGAEEAAAVLDLDVGPRAVDPGPVVDDPRDLDAGERRERGVERAVRSLHVVAGQPEEALHLGQEPVLLVVPHEPRLRIHGGERGPADLHRAAGDDERRPRARAPGAAHGLARLVVRHRGDRAGVHEVEVGPGAVSHELHAARAEEPLHRVHLRLVDLAAEVGDRGPPHRRGRLRRLAGRPRRRTRCPRRRHGLTTAQASWTSGRQ